MTANAGRSVKLAVCRSENQIDSISSHFAVLLELDKLSPSAQHAEPIRKSKISVALVSRRRYRVRVPRTVSNIITGKRYLSSDGCCFCFLEEL